MKTVATIVLALSVSACATLTPQFPRTKVILGGIGPMCCALKPATYGRWNLECGDGVVVVQPANFIVTDVPCGP